MQEKIKTGKTFLGIEFGSTRIKACLVDDKYAPVASGSYEWENKFEDGYWTYSLCDIQNGLRECFRNLSQNVFDKYGVKLTTAGAMGISGMMHGYLAFDADDNLLVPFRTWRNTTTEKAADRLTELFGFNIPQRWSIAHLYQAILNGEEHIPEVSHITTLAGYIHYLLTGRRELGIGEASGMFPISGNIYDENMLKKFDEISTLEKSVSDLLPKVRQAGEKGAFLTESGAKILDPTGIFKSGVPLCPPEGDAGTGMVATNSVKCKTGNVSAGTSIFAMLVLEKALDSLYKEIDMVTTPDGFPVAMVHCNNCCGEIDEWVNLFGEFAKLAGVPADKTTLYDMLYKNTVYADADCGGITTYNYLSGEHITGVEKGRPMYFRSKDSKMTLANFMNAQLYSTMATLKSGVDILFEKEKVSVEQINAHGGLFKVKGVAQQILANALNTNVSVAENAGEGGAWGMALLAAFMQSGNTCLAEWLADNVFANMNMETVMPDNNGVKGFLEYMERYKAGLRAEKELDF